MWCGVCRGGFRGRTAGGEGAGTLRRHRGGQRKLEVRVVATGKREFLVLVRERLDGGKVAKVQLTGKTAGDQVTFAGKQGNDAWAASYADGAITGTAGDAKLELKRVFRKPPSLGKKPPEGAVVLLDGKNFKPMVRRGNEPWYVDDMSKDGWAVWEVPIRTIVAQQPKAWPDAKTLIPEGWELGAQRRRVDTVVGIGEDGSIRVPRGGMNSRQQFEGSLDAHVEFMCPLLPDKRSQGRGNSGCYLPNGEEIQVLDSFGMATYEGGGCGGLYQYKNPDTFDVFSLASLPPLEWQTYDIEYRVRRNAQGKVVGKPRVTVYHNGIKIHDNHEVRRDARKGGFHFQDHGNPVRYRNIWVLPIKDTKGSL
ncbi:DUF1080 domain-containing protein [bacterium]|nr:DUF1080 domain-containing protein [bacterium]